MEPIVVPRTKLLRIIEDNRARHISAFEKAKRAYRISVPDRIRAVARKALKQVAAGKAVSLALHYPYPESHAKEYDRVIGMLRMDMSANINLGASDFESYVKDRWEWSEAFTTSNSLYAKGATRRRK